MKFLPASYCALLMAIPIAYGDSFETSFGADASTGSDSSAIGADASIAYQRATRLSAINLAGNVDISTNSASGAAFGWGTASDWFLQSPAGVLSQSFSASHTETDAVYSSNLNTVNALSSDTAIKLSRNPILSHSLGLNFSYSEAVDSTDDEVTSTSDVSSWTLADYLSWQLSEQSKLYSVLSYKKTDSLVTNATVAAGWSYSKANWLYDASISDTFLFVNSYESQQLGYSADITYINQRITMTAGVEQQIVDSLQLYEIVGAEEPIEENVISKVTSASLQLSGLELFDQALVSIYITGGINEQLLAYRQFDIELSSQSNFSNYGAQLAMPLIWETNLTLAASRAFQSEAWSSLYSLGLTKSLTTNLNASFSTKLVNDAANWAAAISYQY